LTDTALILIPHAALLGGILLEGLGARLLSSRAKGWLALAAVLAALAGVAAAWPAVLAGHPLQASFGHWDGPIRLAYRVDGLSFLFALMGTGIGAAVVLYSVSYLERERAATRFYSLVLLFIAGLVHLVYTADLFLLYLSWELVGLCSFLLVGFWYRQREAAYGARKVLTMTHLAGYGLLGAVILLHARTGSTLWTDPKVQAAFGGGLFLLVLAAALAKSVQFPLHTWIPDAMAAPTPVSALLHAACYVKAGVYLMARLHSFGPWPCSWGLALSWLGAATLLVGVLCAMAQHDLKRLLAFHTVSQIGYMMMGLGLGTPLGIAAGLFHCLNHGLFKGGLFLCAGSVQHACGTRDMDHLGGLGRKMPHTLRIWLVCAAGISGVPLFNGFVSKWMLYGAALEAHQPALALIAWAGSLLTVFSFLKATSGVFLGGEGDATGAAHEVAWTMRAGSGVLAAGCLLLGVGPQLAVRFLVNPILGSLGLAPLTGISWFGLALGEGRWFATGGLLLGLLAMALGAVVYLVARPARGLAAEGAGAVFSGGEPLGPQGRLGASDFSRIVKDALEPFYRATDVDRAYLGVWRGLNRLGAGLDRLSRRLERRGAWVLAGLCLALGAGTVLLPAAAPAAPAPEAALPLLPAAAVALAWLGLTAVAAAARDTRRVLAHLLAAGILTLAGLTLAQGLARGVLLEAAAAAAFLALWALDRRPAARIYLAAVLLSAVGTLGGTWAAGHGATRLALALLLPGLGIKLGLAPLFLWLPKVAEDAPAALTGVVVAVVDVAALVETVALRGSAPWLFDPAWPWVALGLLSAVTGALLALGTGHLKRLLAYSTLVDMGLMTVALAPGSPLGRDGVLLGAAVHALAKGTLFAAVAAPEAAGVSLQGARGLATRYPVPAAGFLVGALAVVGVPPTLGYAAHWRMFGAVAGRPWLLALCAGAAMLTVAVYARAVAVFWWGEPAPDGKPAPDRASSKVPAAVALALSAVLLALGAGGRILCNW
jgi:multicomponent Na+:H+ antiporter subunit A